jgi:hypothetical protein
VLSYGLSLSVVPAFASRNAIYAVVPFPKQFAYSAISYIENNFLTSISSLHFGHILRRNCLLQRVFDGKIKGGIEVTGRRGRRRRKLLDDRKERRGYSHLKEEALDRIMWRARFGRGFGPVVRQTTQGMNERVPQGRFRINCR